eukprot:jgi/Botrbrau1/21593/Bobra.43_1s0003.1
MALLPLAHFEICLECGPLKSSTASKQNHGEYQHADWNWARSTVPFGVSRRPLSIRTHKESSRTILAGRLNTSRSMVVCNPVSFRCQSTQFACGPELNKKEPRRVTVYAGPQSGKPAPDPPPLQDIGPMERALGNMASNAASYFPLWLVLVSGAGLLYPPLLSWFHQDYVPPCLTLTMLAMGTSLTLEDFAAIARRPSLVFLGAVLQYTIMPSVGYAISRLWGLSPAYSVGICLVASCPGGVASNLVSYLAHADVPLSVAMTAVSTLAAVVVTPALTGLLVGALVPVDALGLLLSTLQVVLLPVLLGSYLNQAAPTAVQRAAPFAPLLAVTMTVVVSASVIASRAPAIRQAGLHLLTAIASLHIGGFGLGYVVARLLGVEERQARTISIEVGMQNSALGAVLALQHFPALPLAAVPCAISACMHSLLGSGLAAFWRGREPPVPTSPALT